MIKKSTTLIALLTVILAGVSYDCVAQSKSKNNLHSSNSYPAKQKAVHHVKKETGGRVLDVKHRSSEAGDVWRVKFLKDGRIQYMDVAPQSAVD